jgi:hypothetical protein
MPITTAAANALIETMTTAFAGIGNGAPTTMPRSKKNTDPFAWEVLVSKLLVKFSEARAAVAVEKAIDAGVMFDHKATPRVAGTAAVVYEGDVVRIDLKVTKGRAGFDHKAFIADLLAAGVAPKLVTKLSAKHETTSAAPHGFTPSLIAR